MKRNLKMLFALTALASVSVGYYLTAGGQVAQADAVAQPLPFTQNWSNTGMITANDNWSGVPGIEGYLGQEIITVTGVDPQTVLGTSGVANDLDVIANQSNPTAVTSGGVAEFDGLANPVVALQGSGTADAPHIVININTSGQSNINVAYNLRDVDGSGDNAIQPVALQFRVGNTGDFTNVPAGFVADASTGPNEATLVTPVSAVLPATANNQPLVQVRIITTNAPGTDEWIGIDDINITAGGGPTPTPTPPAGDAILDMNGDGRTDYVVVRNIGSGPSGQTRWFIMNQGGSIVTYDWGVASDWQAPGDFDGDGKDDVSVWRPGTQGRFYILQSSNLTFRVQDFGQTGDDPTVVADYDGDGKDDVAVYRDGNGAGSQSRWYYQPVTATNFTTINWGVAGDVPVTGDYDGDGKGDFVIQRTDGANSRYFRHFATGAMDNLVFGSSNDISVAGDYDGDGKTDIAAARLSGGNWIWEYLKSGDGQASTLISWGVAGDDLVPGDYDGDGKTDLAVWRPGTPSTFYVAGSSVGLFVQNWGDATDFAVAAYNVR